MFRTDTIAAFDTGLPGVHAFRITGQVTREDMAAMARHMLGVFERHGTVDMLLSFATGQTATPGAALSLDAVEVQAKSLSHVRNYATANAPGWAASMVRAMGTLLPVTARSFDTEEQALRWLAAPPRP